MTKFYVSQAGGHDISKKYPCELPNFMVIHPPDIKLDNDLEFKYSLQLNKILKIYNKILFLTVKTMVTNSYHSRSYRMRYDYLHV